MYGGAADPDIILHAISVAMTTESEGEVLGLFGELVGLGVAPQETAMAPRDVNREPRIGLAAVLDAASGESPHIGEWMSAAALDSHLDLWTAVATPEPPRPRETTNGVPVILTPVHGWGVLGLLTEDADARAVTDLEAMAAAAAAALVAEFTPDIVLQELTALGGLRRPSTPHPSTVHANLVLRYLAAAWGLRSASASGLIAIGAWNGENFDAAADDRELVGVAQLAGWTPVTVENGAWVTGNRRGHDTSTMGLARLVWPDLDVQLDRRRREAVLTARGWRVIGVAKAGEKHPASGWFRPRREPLELTQAVVTLRQSFKNSPSSARILGGKPNTGKTVIAQQLARMLHDGEMWDVIVLRPDSRSLSEEAELTDIVTAAREIWLRDRRRRCLVIVEDLRPIDSVTLGDILATAASECGVSVLALARYGDNGSYGWEAGDVATINGIVAREQVMHLAELLARRHQHVYALPAMATVDSIWDLTAGGDLVELDALLRGEERAVRECSETLEPLQKLGLIEEGLAEACFEPDERDALLTAGAIVADGQVAVSVSATDRHRLTATEEARDEAIGDGLLWALSRYFDCSGEHSHDSEITQLILAASAYASPTLTRVMKEPLTTARFREWLTDRDLGTIVAVARALTPHVDEREVASLLDIAMARLEGGRAPVRPLTSLARLVERAQSVSPGSELTPRLVSWMRADKGLGWSLEGSAYFQERVGLAQAASYLSHPEIDGLLLSLMESFLLGVDVDRGSDLRALLKLEDVMNRCARRQEARTGVKSQLLADLRHFHEILAHPPADFAALVAWLALTVRRRAGGFDWGPLIDAHGDAVLSGMRTATPQVVSAALGHLANTNKGFANKLINRLRVHPTFSGTSLRDVLRSRLTAGPAGDAAQLLRCIANLHAQLAHELLFMGSEATEPRADLAQQLATRIRAAMDIKGAGQLLPICHRIDEEFATGPGFAFALAEGLGNDFTKAALQHENRPSVVGYLLAGLWLANASYREATTQRALELVIEHLNRRDPRRQRFAARLGYVMSMDGDFGDDVLRTLRDRVSADRFCEIALGADVHPEALANVHRLARAVHPDFPQAFRARAGQRAASGVPRWRLRGADALVFYAQLASTLRAGGDTRSVETVMGWLANSQDGDYAPATADYWNRVVRAMQGRPGHAAAMLGALHRFHEPLAEQVLELLTADDAAANPSGVLVGANDGAAPEAPGSTDRVQPEESEPRSFLSGLLRQSARDLATFADLLVAVNRINPDASSRLLENIRGSVEHSYEGVTAIRAWSSTWASFLEAFQYEQNTALQADVGRRLMRLRFTAGNAKGEPALSPRSGTRTVLRGIVQERWQGSIEFIASPHIVTALLRLSFMWDSAWGNALGQAVSGERLVRRLENRWLPDLDQLPMLMRTLVVTKSQGATEEIRRWLSNVGSSARLLFSRMALTATSWIVHEAALDETVRHFAVDGLTTRLHHEAAATRVREPFEHWTTLGTAARALHASGNAERIPAHSVQGGLQPGTEAAYLWWKAWSPCATGDVATLAAAWSVIEDAVPRRMASDHVAMALIAGARLGLLTPEGLERESAAWSVAASARLHLVAEMRDTFVGTPGFGEWFEKLVPALADRLAGPGMEFYQGYAQVAEYRRVDEPTFF